MKGYELMDKFAKEVADHIRNTYFDGKYLEKNILLLNELFDAYGCALILGNFKPYRTSKANKRHNALALGRSSLHFIEREMLTIANKPEYSVLKQNLFYSGWVNSSRDDAERDSTLTKTAKKVFIRLYTNIDVYQGMRMLRKDNPIFTKQYADKIGMYLNQFIYWM